MTRWIVPLFMAIFAQALPGLVRADNLTPAQLSLRTEILAFVREEGFAPTIDESDNSVTFKKEGVLHWITVGGTGPFYLEFHRAGLDCENADRAVVLQAVNEANKKIRSAKAILFDTSVSFAVEVFVHSVEEFKYTFYTCMKELDSAKKKVSEYYEEHSGEISSAVPFRISSVSVANTEQDGSLISAYGSKIYSYKSKYITPKIYADVQTAGTYDLYVKFYTPAGLSTARDGSSPAGYSYKAPVTMSGGIHSYTFNGWGGNDAGHWKAGEYRFEFYYKGERVGQTTFTIH